MNAEGVLKGMSDVHLNSKLDITTCKCNFHIIFASKDPTTEIKKKPSIGPINAAFALGQGSLKCFFLEMNYVTFNLNKMNTC